MKNPNFTLTVALLGILLHLGTTSGVGLRAARADVVTIPPTSVSADPVQQVLNSVTTLTALQAAIDNSGAPYPGGQRKIKLEVGTYDLRAVAIIVPRGRPNPALQAVLNANYTQSAVVRDVYFFDPKHFGRDPAVVGDPGYGLIVLGREGLAIVGAPLDPEGRPRSVIVGNQELNARGFPDLLYNNGMTVGGGTRDLTIRRLLMRGFESIIKLQGDGGTFGDPPDAPFLAGGTDDVSIRHNRFEMLGFQGVATFGRHHRVTIRDNVFLPQEGAPFFAGFLSVNTIGIGMPFGFGHLVDYHVENNEFINVLVGIRLESRHERTVVRKNSIRLKPGGIGILAGDAEHGIRPSFANHGSVIEDNTVEGGDAGIAIFSGFGWSVQDNRIYDPAIAGIWTEWGPFNLNYPDGIQLTSAEENVVVDNTVVGSGTFGILVGAYSRNNFFAENEFYDSAIADYFLSGPQDIGIAVFGPASGNQIVFDSEETTLIDESGCTGSVCVQRDDDGDGSVNEDSIDGIDNDGDGIADEDPEDLPNVIG